MLVLWEPSERVARPVSTYRWTVTGEIYTDTGWFPFGCYDTYDTREEAERAKAVLPAERYKNLKVKSFETLRIVDR